MATMKFKLMVIKMIIRFIIACLVIGSYFYDKNILSPIFAFKMGSGFSLLYCVWLFIMADILMNFVPYFNIYSGSGNLFKRNFIAPQKGYDEQKLKKTSKTYFKRSLLVLFLWVSLNIVLCTHLGPYELVLLSAVYFAGDMACILIWCPFQFFIMKSRCCSTCVLFCWGYVMFCMPLAFIGCFFARSLFIMSLLLFLFWEYKKFIYPERFFEQSNKFLSCKNCAKGFCRIKKPMY